MKVKHTHSWIPAADQSGTGTMGVRLVCQTCGWKQTFMEQEDV